MGGYVLYDFLAGVPSFFFIMFKQQGNFHLIIASYISRCGRHPILFLLKTARSSAQSCSISSALLCSPSYSPVPLCQSGVV